MLLLLCGVVGFGYYRLSGNLHSVDIDGLLGPDRPKRVASGARNIVILGSDSRAGKNQEYGEDEGSARSDTTMVLHLAQGRKKASVVSIPRDTLVERPPCKDSDDGHRHARARHVMFNTAYEVGGPACAVKTVEELSGVRMDHFVDVDFTGFKKLVDAIGGVRMTIPQSIDDDHSRLHLTKGTHKLDGEQALGLVRTRHGYGDGSDLGRIKLQQLFIHALAAQVKDLGVLSNPAKLYRVADSATKAVTTDEDLGSLSKLVSFGRSVSDIGSRDMRTRTLPVAPAPRNPNRVVPRKDDARELWRALRQDRPLPKKSAEGSRQNGQNGQNGGSGSSRSSGRSPDATGGRGGGGTAPSNMTNGRNATSRTEDVNSGNGRDVGNIS